MAITTRREALIRRAINRNAMGRGGAATANRIASADRPTATVNDPTAPHAIGGTAQPLSGTPRNPSKPSKPKAPPKAPKAPGIDATTKSLLDAAVRLKFGGQEQGIGNQLQDNNRFTAGLKGWYAQAIDQIKGQRQPLPAVSAPAPVQPTGDPIADQAAQSRAGLETAWQQRQASSAQAGNDFIDRIAAAMVVQQGNAQIQAQRERQGLLSQQTQLKGDEGAFGTQYLGDLNAAQQKAAMDQAKLVTQQLRDQAAIDIQQGNLQLAKQRLAQADRIYQNVTLPNSQATRSNDATSQAKSQAELDYFNSHGYWPPTGPPKKGKGSGSSASTFSRTDGQTNAHHKLIRDVNNTIANVKRLRSQGFSDAAITGALEKDHVPADVLDAATTLAGGGRLNATQIKQLKLAGLIAAPKAWKAPKVRIAPPRPEVSVGYPN